MKSRIFNFIVCGLLTSCVAGCASFGQTLKSLLGGGSRTPASTATPSKMGKIKKKNYRKVTRKTLEEESELGEGSGSLWISRGQGAYLFHQNTKRLIGDIINIEIDGQPKKQIETKVKVIEKLIGRLKARQKAMRMAQRKKKRRKSRRKVASAPKTKPKTDTADGKSFDVKLVPTRIVGILKDGSYRIHGDQSFMIGRREYKVVVSGIVRQEDFDDQGIAAETLLDPKFDIVTAKKRRRKI